MDIKVNQTGSFGVTKPTDEKTMHEQVYDIENLYRAAKRAMKGKKAKSAAAKFWFRQDQEIAKIHRELKEERYSFGDYTEFQITDNGVTRRISAAPRRFGHTKHLQPLSVLRSFGTAKPTKGIG